MKTDKFNTFDQSVPLVVIGAGIVGVTTALRLRQMGYKVILLTSNVPGSKDTASYGNAGWLSPGSVVPTSMPGMWRKIPSYLFDSNGPLRLRISALPFVWRWLLRFIACGATHDRAAAIASGLRPFLSNAPERHTKLANEAGVPDLIQRKGLVIIYRNKEAYEADAFSWQLRRENGVRWQILDRTELEDICSTLSQEYTFGVLLHDGAYCTDPGRYVAALADLALVLGVKFINAHADGFLVRAGRLRGIQTPDGIVACNNAVVAAGMGSRVLGGMIGDNIPLVSERGYHVQISGLTDAPSIPIMLSDRKFVVTPMADGLRVAGQVEFARDEAPPDWRRAHILFKGVCEGLSFVEREDLRIVKHWMGNRPSTPDCLPIIGPSPNVDGVFYATGHGHLGLVGAPWTAELIGGMIVGQSVSEATPYDPLRFSVVNKYF